MFIIVLESVPVSPYYLSVAQIEESRSLVLIQSCSRHAIRANVIKLSKQVKRLESLPRDLSRHSIYPRYIRPTDNARQTKWQ